MWAISLPSPANASPMNMDIARSPCAGNPDALNDEGTICTGGTAGKRETPKGPARRLGIARGLSAGAGTVQRVEWVVNGRRPRGAGTVPAPFFRLRAGG